MAFWTERSYVSCVFNVDDPYHGVRVTRVASRYILADVDTPPAVWCAEQDTIAAERMTERPAAWSGFAGSFAADVETAVMRWRADKRRKD